MKKVPLFETDSHSTNRKYVTAKIAKIAPEAVILPDINAPEHYNRIAYKTGKPDNGLNSRTVAADKITKDIKAKLREIGVKGSILASNYSGDDVCNAVVIFGLKDFEKVNEAKTVLFESPEYFNDHELSPEVAKLSNLTYSLENHLYRELASKGLVVERDRVDRIITTSTPERAELDWPVIKKVCSDFSTKYNCKVKAEKKQGAKPSDPTTWVTVS